MRRGQDRNGMVARNGRSTVVLTNCGAPDNMLPDESENTEADSRFSPGIASQTEHTPYTVSLTGKRVLICEDEGITLLQLKKLLTRAGLHVVGVATNGKDGVDIALRERPHIVLMDIKMPIMNGLEAAETILHTYSTCIIMLTAFSDPEYRQKAEEIGTSGYIVKPITGNTLPHQIQTAYENYLESAG